MKKRIICLLAALLLLLGLSVSASAAVYANVIDTAELLSESEAEALDARCSELEQTYGCGVYLVTVDDYTAYYSAKGGRKKLVQRIRTAFFHGRHYHHHRSERYQYGKGHPYISTVSAAVRLL